MRTDTNKPAHIVSAIKEIADGVREKLKDGKLYGYPIDGMNIDEVIAAAYLAGQTDVATWGNVNKFAKER